MHSQWDCNICLWGHFSRLKRNHIAIKHNMYWNDSDCRVSRLHDQFNHIIYFSGLVATCSGNIRNKAAINLCMTSKFVKNKRQPSYYLWLCINSPTLNIYISMSGPYRVCNINENSVLNICLMKTKREKKNLDMMYNVKETTTSNHKLCIHIDIYHGYKMSMI